ncbi:MAG: hypothetical protein ACI4VQ_07555 [Clostridia bacterium]
MEQETENIQIPQYIKEEIEEYIELTEYGKNKCMKWDNIRALLRLAVINKRITNEQAKIIEERYYLIF